MVGVIEELILESATVFDAAVSSFGDVPFESEFEVEEFYFGGESAGFGFASGSDAIFDGPDSFAVFFVSPPLREVVGGEEVGPFFFELWYEGDRNVEFVIVGTFGEVALSVGIFFGPICFDAAVA